MKLSDIAPSSAVKILVFGPPKVGKTALVGKLAKTHKLWWLDLESGIKTLLNPAILAPEYRGNINVINIPDHRNYPIAIDTVRAIFKGGLTKVCNLHGKVNCPICVKSEGSFSEINLGTFTKEDVLVIDSLSQLALSAMNRGIIKELQKPDGDEYRKSFSDYAYQGALMENILSYIQVLNVNVVGIAHELEAENLEGREKIVPALGTRNFSLNASKYFDTVVYCTITNKQHRAFSDTTHSPSIISGSRLPIGSAGLNITELSSIFQFAQP